MTDDELHALRVIFGVAVDRAAHRLHDSMEAFRHRYEPGHVPVTWSALTDADRNAYRSALTDLADEVDLARLIAAARLLDRP